MGMKIGHFDLDADILIVAEIGNNHEGSYALAEEMIGLAARAGANAVKFQTIVPERLVSPREIERIRQLERFRLSYQEYTKLAQVAQQAGVLFLSTPFDLDSARFLDTLVPAFKIASGDNNFYPLIEVIAKTGKPIICSTGLADLAQVRRTRDFILDCWQRNGITQDMAVLHCVTSYPTQPQDANLGALLELKTLGLTVGYSDHTLGIEAAVLSVALGARIIEKHFTLGNNYSSFRDHQLSANPEQFKSMVERIREAAVLIGSTQKRVLPSEQAFTVTARRSIVAARDLAAGTIITFDDLTWVRPGGGLTPGEERRLIGKRLQRAVVCGEMILPADVDE